MFRVLLFCDSKYRDLPGNALLKKSLENALPDSFVQICSFHLWREAIELFAPHLVVLNNVQGKRNKNIASYVKRHGGIVVVAFTEGIIEFTDKAKIFEAQRGHKDVDYFLCWNEPVAELVDGIVTGCPRFDIYQKPERIDSRELFCDKWGLDPNKKIVVFGDSWPSAKFTYSMQSFHRDNWEELGNTEADKWSDAGAFAGHQHGHQQSFKQLIEVLYNVSEKDTQFVLKSHPMSDYLMWARWGERTGIPVIHSEYSFNVLNACDVYITKAGSVTVAEAWLLNRPVIKLISDYDTASSVEQLGADRNNFDWATMNDMNDINGRLFTLLDGYLLDGYTDEDVAKSNYLDKWGMSTQNSAHIVSDQLVSILENTAFVLRYNPNYLAFIEALHKHDLAYSSNILDGFGNWNKTTLQRDVQAWNV